MALNASLPASSLWPDPTPRTKDDQHYVQRDVVIPMPQWVSPAPQATAPTTPQKTPLGNGSAPVLPAHVIGLQPPTVMTATRREKSAHAQPPPECTPGQTFNANYVVIPIDADIGDRSEQSPTETSPLFPHTPPPDLSWSARSWRLYDAFKQVQISPAFIVYFIARAGYDFCTTLPTDPHRAGIELGEKIATTFVPGFIEAISQQNPYAHRACVGIATGLRLYGFYMNPIGQAAAIVFLVASMKGAPIVREWIDDYFRLHHPGHDASVGVIVESLLHAGPFVGALELGRAIPMHPPLPV